MIFIYNYLQTADYKSKQKNYNEQYNQYNDLTAKITRLQKEKDLLEEKVDEATVNYLLVNIFRLNTKKLKNQFQILQVYLI